MGHRGWALDLGTTNSAMARWDEGLGQPLLVELPEICRKPEGDDPLEAPRLVPSVVHLLEERGLLDRLGSWRPLARRMFLGRVAVIGRPALERNYGLAHPAFVPAFKPALVRESLRPLARVGRHSVTAREAAQAFLRELLAEVKRATGDRVRDLVVTSPVSAFEAYRAEIQHALQGLGVRKVRFVDEPVALGYGLSLTQEQTLVVVDIGGGTMHVVLVRLSPHGALGGQATVLAKQVRPFGGNAVDGWVLADACQELGCPLAGRVGARGRWRLPPRWPPGGGRHPGPAAGRRTWPAFPGRGRGRPDEPGQRGRRARPALAARRRGGQARPVRAARMTFWESWRTRRLWGLPTWQEAAEAADLAAVEASGKGRLAGRAGELPVRLEESTCARSWRSPEARGAWRRRERAWSGWAPAAARR